MAGFSRQPLVTIGLPVLNGAPYIRRALRSIVEQEYSNLEVIVSDNQSSDATPEIVQAFSAQDDRIRLERVEQRISLVGNWNRLIHMAKGDYFKWASHDDWIAPEYVATCLQRLLSDANSGLAFTDMVLVDPKGDVVGGSSEDAPSLDSEDEIDRVRAAMWRIKGFPSAEQGLSRTRMLLKTGGMQNVLPQGRLWLVEMALLGTIRHVPESLLFRQVDTTQYTRDPWTYQHPENTPRTIGTHLATVRSFHSTFRRHGLSEFRTSTMMAELSARLVLKRLEDRRVMGAVDRSDSRIDVRELLPASERHPFGGQERVTDFVRRTAVQWWSDGSGATSSGERPGSPLETEESESSRELDGHRRTDAIRVLYIAGYGRSGSTLLDLLVGNADRVEGMGELSAIFEAIADGRTCSCGKPFAKCAKWSPVLGHLKTEAAGDWREAARLTLRGESLARIGQNHTGYQELWVSLLRQLAEEFRFDVIVDSSKTSWAAARRPLQLARLPGVDVRLVHLVRDPRAVLWSVRRGDNRVLERQGRAPRGSMLRGLLGWLIGNWCAEYSRWRFPPDHSMRLRYETLAEKPGVALSTVGEFAGIDVTSVVGRLENEIAMSSGHGVLGNRMRRASKISVESDREWEEKLSLWAQLLVFLVAPMVRRYGYDVIRRKA